MNTSSAKPITVDGNEAAASVAFRSSEVVAIYPITPASPMGELSDAWSAQGKTNVWGLVPSIIEMQSEAGAAGTLHGSLQGGALTTTFTASQGLLLMIPNMYKIAGELLPSVIHVAARTLATHALSIFGDHSDVMATRAAGWAMLASGSVQEAHDMALVAHAATLESRIPFLHFFDGFRTSHEVAKIHPLSDDDLRAVLPLDGVLRHRANRMDPDKPVLRGTAQNPDVFFQAREAANPFYAAVPDIVQGVMDKVAERTGRQYHLFDYSGHPEAERVIVMMGSGTGPAHETVSRLVADGEKVGLLEVRLYRPFSAEALVAAIPQTVKTIAVLDRTKEPGQIGEPLYQDVVTAVVEESTNGRVSWDAPPRVIGGRYGLSSKEFTPAMVKTVLDEAAATDARRHFTIGIHDDVSHLSLSFDSEFSTEPEEGLRAVFFGLGSDGTVGANKNTVKIIGEETPLHAQGYFVYDSKKSGAITVSHLRFSPEPITSTYLIKEAEFVGCHQFDFLEKLDVLGMAKPGATVLINTRKGPDELWDKLPRTAQAQIIEKGLKVHAVDGNGVAEKAGLGGRINTVLQTCFFALSGVIPTDEAIEAIKGAIAKTYAKFGETVLERNYAAVDGSLEAMYELEIPSDVTSEIPMRAWVPDDSPDFVQRVIGRIMAGEGDLLPVSAFPVDGTFPTATAKYEKRSIAHEIPIFDPDICIQCAKCTIVCPHAAIRMKVFEPSSLEGAPESFISLDYSGKDFPDHMMTIQVAPDDCTGCGVCVDVCPAKSKEIEKHKAINMEPKAGHLDAERANFDFFLDIPEPDRTKVRIDTVKGSQMLEPLFEFSGACSGCGETPYLKLLTQMGGDRAIIANATGCSSIFGGNLPTTPWTVNDEGRGPVWANSLFEDNAEFGLGMRLALDAEIDEAERLVAELSSEIGEDLATALLNADQSDEAGIATQRGHIAELDAKLEGMEDDRARRLAVISGTLARKSVWIVGGDGWAYDIGFSGVDHVLASGRNVNVFVLDTEVYSNTGGQASKATPRGAVAKFAAGGKETGKKDLGQIAMAYGNVYVAQIAIGANNVQSVKAIAQAEAYDGPSLIIAYSTCIAHGIDMGTSMSHQKELVESGYWPLYRFEPDLIDEGKNAFHLDSRRKDTPFKDVAASEARYAMLKRTDPAAAQRLMIKAQEDIDDRWELYKQLADIERTPHPEEES
ncbi:MAG: pyruvate:ferredoxin (flavodoxin) oxidoreductase [Acidimicrobiia bacterium]|nr:pyruvate:ferredoxin (flavodoxin) oxidoreductase [Acidimicrobiia bacterium]